MYKALSTILPPENQNFLAFSYYLNEDPINAGVGVVRPEPSEKGASYGGFIPLGVFQTQDAANEFCDKINEKHKVRSVVPKPMGNWIPLSTVLRLDEATHTPSGTDRSLMKASAVDKGVFVYRPNLRLTADMTQRTGSDPARQVSAAAYSALALQEEIEEHRKAILEANMKLARGERQIQTAALTFEGWDQIDGAAIRDILPVAIVAKMRSFLEEHLTSEKPVVEPPVSEELPQTLEALISTQVPPEPEVEAENNKKRPHEEEEVDEDGFSGV